MKCWQSAARLSPLLLALATAACGDEIQSAVNPAGPPAYNLNHLWWVMFYVCSLVYLIVMILLLYTLKTARAASQPPAAPILTPSAGSERRMRNVVISAVAVTIVIMFALLVVSFQTGRSIAAGLYRKDAVTIEITGHQWWWEARYMDPDASKIFTTANEVHIPVGVPVIFSLRSTDVIHSFWVPNFNGKKDLIPGKVATVWFQADKTGVFRGQCAEYCGLQHALMGLWIVAQTPEEFNEWRKNQTQSAVSPPTDLARRGQQVFLSSSCVMCHAISGTPAGSNIGPNLTHLASRSIIAGATALNTREELAQWITNSQMIKPGNKMPQNTLSQPDLEALLDYLQSLK
ncbi:MAG TPA: cytochrome c oxidase subunit II [Pyrinomonadaceae bacterium]|nr:cytochrome c oxidase subunit II [Pyrinomonadaceae bacterium]